MRISIWGTGVLEEQRKAAIIMSLLTLGLYFSGLFVFLTPLPFIYFSLKFRKASFVSAVWPSLIIVACLYLLGTDFFYNLYQNHPKAYWILPVPFLGLIEHFNHATVMLAGIGYYCLFLGMGFTIVRALLCSQNRVFQTMAWSVLGIFLISLLLGVVAIFPQSDVFFASYHKSTEIMLEQFIATQQQSGASLHQVVSFQSTMKDYAEKTVYLLPFVLLIVVSFLYIFNLLIAKRFYSHYFKELKKTNLTVFRIPFIVVWPVLGVALLLLLNEVLIKTEGLFYFFLNILLSAIVVYFLLGISIGVFLLDKKKIFGFTRLFIYFGVLLLGEVTLFIFAALGFADNWLDLRKLEQDPAQQS